MHDYKKLKIWKESVDFSVQIYKVTASFPKEEMYGLVSQLRRASISIASNIAEGSKRSTKKDFKSFLVIAHGSGAEIETQLRISKELNFINEKKYLELTSTLDEIMRMIAVFGKSISG
jgi:four helix bundle protein